jgi:hypothetical protein
MIQAARLLLRQSCIARYIVQCPLHRACIIVNSKLQLFISWQNVQRSHISTTSLGCRHVSPA